MEMLLDHGASPDVRDANEATPLWVAAAAGHAGVVRLLGSRGTASINAKSKEGRTALWTAVSNDRRGAVTELLALGVDVNEKDANGRSPLLIAAHRGDTELIEALIKVCEMNRSVSFLFLSSLSAAVQWAPWATASIVFFHF